MAVVGSQGKTTAAKVSHHLLEPDGPALLSAYLNNISTTMQRLRKVRRQDRFAVFELAENASSDRDHLAEAMQLLRPHAVLMTVVANDHFSQFRSRENAAAVMASAVRAVGYDGVVLLNADDPLVMGMKAQAIARVVTYGRSADADYRASDVALGDDGWLRFTCTHGDETADFALPVAAPHLLPSVLGAIALASQLGVALCELARRATTYENIPGRCSIHRGEDGTTFVCDTVKAVQDTLSASFAVCDAFRAAPRRTIVIGTISDYPGTARPKYQKAYLAARTHAERVIMFGPNNARVRPLEEDMQDGAFMAYETLRALEDELARTAIPGELIFLKSSGSDHLKRIALAAERPVTCRKERCGVSDSWFSCDLLFNPAPVPLRFLLGKLRQLRARMSRVPEFR